MAIVHNDNTTPWKLRPLTTNEQAGAAGFTHIATLTANDLTTTGTNTAQTFTLASLKAGDIIVKSAWVLRTAFKDASDAAYNSNTVSLGDTATGVAAHIAAIQVNENGTEVFYGFNNTAVLYTAADTVTFTFNSMSAKALNDIDTGEITIFVQLLRLQNLAKAVAATTLTK